MILLQTKIFNAFHGTVEQSSVFRILSSNCPCETESYVPKYFLLVNRLFINLANRSNNVYLTIDCQGINPNGPSKS